MKRQRSKPIQVGSITIADGAPIRVQSMTKSITSDVQATVADIDRLEGVGYELIRVAVPDLKAAQALPDIKRQIHIPLMASTLGIVFPDCAVVDSTHEEPLCSRATRPSGQRNGSSL